MVRGYMFSVSFCTTLNLLKNSLAKTRKTVYAGMASNMPMTPAIEPAANITRNISSG